MKVLLASSEVHPYSKSGGLADMVGAMAKYVAHHGLSVGVVTPLYRGMRESVRRLKRLDWEMELPLGNRLVKGEVWICQPEDKLTIYFIDQPELFDRAGMYGELGEDYPDNAARFIYFSKAVTQLARYLPWRPEIVHLHDWQTGLVPVMILHQSIWEGWGNPPKTCYTIHNLAYQGSFDVSEYGLANLPWDYFRPQGAEFYGRLNCMKAGIVFADQITTVSPRYASEILTPEFGCGLEGVLRDRSESLLGILNGVDYAEWKTSRNKYLGHSYTVDRLAGKARNKVDLQRELGLKVAPEIPLFGNITRLVDQKGVDIQLEVLEDMLHKTEMQFALLGSGSAHYEAAYTTLADEFPHRLAAHVGYDLALSHRIEAAADFYLMPSRFEPCGLNQMYSLRYGTIPIVRKTGGLDDAIIDITEDAVNANGIKFEHYSSAALAKAVQKALTLYEHKDLLAHYRRNAMEADYSWERTTKEYLRLYRHLLQE